VKRPGADVTAAARSDGLRVALLTPCYWPEVRRGGERFVHDLATGLSARGHLLRIVTSHPRRPQRSTEDGVRVIRHWRPRASALARLRLEDHLTHVPFSYLTLRAGHDDVSQAVYPTDALAAARWSRRTGRPSIYACLGMPHGAYLASRRQRARITRAACRECTAVTALSRAAAQSLRRWLGVEARVIYPGVDLGLFTPSPTRAPQPTLWFPGAAADPMKRADLLLSAFRLVRRERPATRLILERPRNPSLARKLEAPGVEQIEPLVETAGLVERYRESWVTVLPSVGEAFGLVLAESLACGTPVVASKVGGMPEVLDREGIGLLFDGDDPEPLAQALLEALELTADPAVPAGCRQRAEELSLERTAEAYEALYRELAGAGTAGRRHLGR
jgi:glycosyltransferase involved in cell wall biosynthesis